MNPARIAFVLLLSAPIADMSVLQTAGAASTMTAPPFDGSRRIVVITAGSADGPKLREQRAEFLKHVAALDERDMVVVVALPGHRVEPVHGPAPSGPELAEFLRRHSFPEPRDASPFAVLLIGKDGGVKFRSTRPVRAEELFALIDTMPMRRREMKR